MIKPLFLAIVSGAGQRYFIVKNHQMLYNEINYLLLIFMINQEGESL